MVSLSVMTWVRFLVWLDLGMVIYWFYGRTHSPLVTAPRQRARTGRARSSRTSCTILGCMLARSTASHHAARRS